MYIRRYNDGSEAVVFEEYDVSCTSDNGNHSMNPEDGAQQGAFGGTCAKCGHFYGVKPVSEVAADVVEAARKETPRYEDVSPYMNNVYGYQVAH